jgi:hypothetical protein
MRFYAKCWLKRGILQITLKWLKLTLNIVQVFGPVFERNSRWSQRKHVPQLGTPQDSKEKVY